MDEYSRLAAIFDTLREPLLVRDADLHIVTADRAFYHVFPEETRGCLLYALGNGRWNIPRLRELLGKILPEHPLRPS